MKQLTIRGFDSELEAAIRKLSRAEGISLSSATMRLLRSAAGLSDQKRRRSTVGSALDAFIGTWTAKQARDMSAASKDFERVDDELWK